MKKNSYLTLGGLFIALHLLFILMSKILVGSELILLVFLPLLSTIYSLKFSVKEVTMFSIATFLLCVFFEPISTFIYVLPALICGVTYGLLRKTKIKELSLVYVTTLSHALSLLVSFLSISMLFKEVDFFSIFESFIDKEGNAFYVSVYLILIALGLFESFLVHMVSNSELIRLGFNDLSKEEETPHWMCIGFILILLTYIILNLIDPVYGLYVFPYLLAFSLPIIVEFVVTNKNKLKITLVLLMLLISIFLLGNINPMYYPSLIIFWFSPCILEKIVRVLYTFLLKYSNTGKNKIK